MVQVLAGSLLFWEIQTHLLHWIWISSNTLAYSISSWEYLCHMCSFASHIQWQQKEKECTLSSIKVTSTLSRYELLLWSLHVWVGRLNLGYCQTSRQTYGSYLQSYLKCPHIYFFTSANTPPGRCGFVPAVCNSATGLLWPLHLLRPAIKHCSKNQDYNMSVFVLYHPILTFLENDI